VEFLPLVSSDFEHPQTKFRCHLSSKAQPKSRNLRLNSPALSAFRFARDRFQRRALRPWAVS